MYAGTIDDSKNAKDDNVNYNDDNAMILDSIPNSCILCLAFNIPHCFLMIKRLVIQEKC